MSASAEKKRFVLINDPTLRDGNHAVRHQLSVAQITAYAAAAEAARIPIVEVGHGNGLAASSLQIGESPISDREMIEAARGQLKHSKLAIHCIPSFATIQRDLQPALEMGVDVVRVAAHCTEADITEKQMGYVRKAGREAYGALMMTHMASAERLAEECAKMESYGAQGVVLMDSVGTFLPDDVRERISTICAKVKIPIGFHAHNNLGMGIANSLAALEVGASFLDASARGFGAGAGNAQLEVLVAVLHKLGYETGIDLYKLLDASDVAEKELMKVVPSIKPVSIVSGLAGVFSGFAKHVERISAQYQVNPKDVFFELGKRRVVAGQEDVIIEVAMDLVEKSRGSDVAR